MIKIKIFEVRCANRKTTVIEKYLKITKNILPAINYQPIQ